VHVYRLRSRRRISPFGDEARDLYVADRSIGAWQKDAVTAAGFTLTDAETFAEVTARPCVVFSDDVWFTEMALRQFLADARAQPGDRILAMPDGAAAKATEPLQGATACEGGRLHAIAYLTSPGPIESFEAIEQRAQPLLIDKRERTKSIALPPSMVLGADGRRTESDSAAAPLTARLVANVRHWIHLLRLSQLAIGVTLLDRLRAEPRRALRLRFSRKKDPASIARKLVFVDPTAQVHPTADLEAAVIGPGVVVEAHAHVHRSILGPGVIVQDHSTLMASTLAEGVRVLRSSYFAFCGAMPGATLANYKAQLSLFGRDVFLTTTAMLIDAKLQGEVRVEHEGALVPVGPFLGACLGHRVTLGAQVAVQAGRAIPNGSLVVGDPGAIGSEFGAYPEGTPLTIRDGKLVPLDSSGHRR
jgi:carbonic anhydrase/acetyltransferase-like protein (isoleucine patch superfamily)